MMPQDGLCLPSSINNVSFVHPQEPAFHPNPNPNPTAVAPSANPNPAGKRKRNLPGTPDPDAEVVALSPKSLMATNRFICEICNKGFQREQNLQLHRRGHNLPWKLKQRTNKDEMVKKKVFICPEKSCVHHDASRALGDLTGIKKHYSRKHGEKKWKCDKCSKKYAVMSDWKAHSKICGTREYKCDCGTIFSRKDSFITHREFCDALAEESARIVAKAPPNFKADFNILGGSSMTNAHHQAAVNLMPHFASAAAFRSNLPPPPLTGINDHDFHVNGGGGGTISMKPTRLPLWLDQRHIMTSPNDNIITTSNASNIMETNMINIHDHDHHRCTAHDDHEIIMMCGGTGEAGGGFLASSTLAAGGNSCSADHDFMTQMGPSTTCFFGTDTMHFPPRLLHLKEESDQQDHHNKTGAGGYNTATTTTSGCSPATDYCYTPQRLQAAASYSSHNLIHHMQQQSSSSSSSSVNTAVGGNMSATALLQKAANIGSTRSHSSGFANSLGVVSTLCPFSNLVSFNNTRRSKDQQAVMSAAGRDRPCRKQQQDDEDLSVLMNSMPSSSSDINGDRRELLGTAGDQFPVSCSSATVQQVIMGMGNNSTATNTASGVVKRADHEDGKMSDCTNVIQGDYIDKGFDSATRDFLGLGGGGGGSSDRRAAAGGGKTPLIFQQDHHHQLPSFPNSVDLTHHFDTPK